MKIAIWVLLIFSICFESKGQFRKLDALDSIYIKNVTLYKKAILDLQKINKRRKLQDKEGVIYFDLKTNYDYWKNLETIQRLFDQKLTNGISMFKDGTIYFSCFQRKSYMHPGLMIYTDIKYIPKGEKGFDMSDFMEIDFWKIEDKIYYWSER